MKIDYIRVSKQEQNESLQEEVATGERNKEGNGVFRVPFSLIC
jgi:hypothetical protein